MGKEVTDSMEIPQIGVPRMLGNGETWRKGHCVTLVIDKGGKIIEIRTVDGSEPTTTIKAFTPPGEEEEQAVLDATTIA